MRKECYIFSILFTPTCNIWYQHYPWHVWSWSHFVQSKCWKYKKPVIEDIRRTVFQYHKANIKDLKAKLLHFQNQFLTSDECSTSVEANWLSFKHAIDEAMRKYIPQKTCKSTNDLPWLTHSIKTMMKQCKRLCKLARSLQTEEARSNYCKLKNKITNNITASVSHTTAIRTTCFCKMASWIISSSGGILNVLVKIILEWLCSM